MSMKENNLLMNNDNVLLFTKELFNICISQCLSKIYNVASNGITNPLNKETFRLGYVSLPSHVKYLIPWLDDSTRFIFTYNLDESTYDEKSEKAVRLYSGDGVWIRETNDKDVKYKICNASIYINLNINIYKESYQKDIKNLRDKLTDIREFVIHELSHIYDDYKTLINKEEESKNKFSDAYSKIIAGRKSKNTNEVFFCDTVYMTNKYESFAYKSEFYQSLINDIEIKNKRLNDISVYWPYNKYRMIYSSIDSRPINNDLFEKYKTYIIDIFGTSFSTLKQFRINIKFELNSILENLDNIYICAKKVEDDFFSGKRKSWSIEDAEKTYQEYKKKVLSLKLESIREDHVPVYQTYFEKYSETPIDLQIKIFKDLLELLK